MSVFEGQGGCMNLKTRYLTWSAGSFLLSSLILFFIPVFPRVAHPLMATILAVVFWGFFVAGIILTALLSKNNPSDSPAPKGVRKVFRLFATKPLKIVDTLLILAVLAAILTTGFSVPTGMAGYFIIFLILYMIELHCVLIYTQ
jgi:hypothetical protein